MINESAIQRLHDILENMMKNTNEPTNKTAAQIRDAK